MSDPIAPTTQPPELTPASVKLIIARLGEKLTPVEQSAATDAVKAEIRTRILAIMTHLNNGLQLGEDLTEEDLSDWTEDAAPQFAKLTPLLKDALGLADEDVGACKYRGSTNRIICIMTTADGCQGVGDFYANQTCP